MTYKEFIEKYKGTHLYVNINHNQSVRAYLDYNGVVSFELPFGDEITIKLLSLDCDLNEEVNKTPRGFHICETDTGGFSDWDIFTCAEESY